MRMRLPVRIAAALLPMLLTAQSVAEAPAPPRSRALSLASAEEVERMADAQYRNLLSQAAAARALAPPDHPIRVRVRAIADRMIPHAPRYNERARSWRWELNVFGSKQINAFCMPGGKIGIFTGIVDRLQLTDDEIAMVIAHEIAHALQEHGRERVGQARAAQWVTLGASVFSQILGYGDLGGALASGGSQMLLLKYGRDDELEADAIGMELAARAGFDPRAAVSLWQKMSAQAQRAPPEWLSTHPSHANRIRQIEARLPKVLPIYAQAVGRPADKPPPPAAPRQP
ncbi:MAG TPA: M48 family metallopeptidase [Burkholderiaceae bacterium]|nr:M48 family metallopeptidase [Burkholderiaceae bacterium]